MELPVFYTTPLRQALLYVVNNGLGLFLGFGGSHIEWLSCKTYTVLFHSNTESPFPERLQNGVYFSQATRQEQVCNVDQTVRQVRMPTEFKLATFCMYFKVLNIPLHSLM